METFSSDGRGLSHVFKVLPEKEINELHIIWPKLPNSSWHSKCLNYLTHVLGHEGPNSLHSELEK